MTVADAFDDLSTTATLLVTVQPPDDTYREGRDAIEKLERREPVDGPDTIAFPSGEMLLQTLTARTLGLLRAIAKEEPTSIRETARLVDRDVKNVHTELTELARIGVVRFEENGRGKRPVFPYQHLVIDLPFDRETARFEAIGTS